MTSKLRLLLATNNTGKVREYALLLTDIPFKLATPADVGVKIKVAETGQTFADNAKLKAEAYASASGLITLADDSGLEVDVLAGKPGIQSARYGGEGLSDQERYNLLLKELQDISPGRRTARFYCVIAIANPVSGEIVLCDGECRGIITSEPHGKLGFGYDPIFYVPEVGKTFAELTDEEKNRISHRARATQKANEILRIMSLK